MSDAPAIASEKRSGLVGWLRNTYWLRHLIAWFSGTLERDVERSRLSEHRRPVGVDETLDPTSFPRDTPWKARLSTWINREATSPKNPFLAANADLVSHLVTDDEAGVRMVINIPPDALLSFLDDASYKNAYDRPTVAGKRRGPSAKRREVDTLLGFEDGGRNFYFGAVALGGMGVRFYGEYCMVLRANALPQTTAVFDRNSYDLLGPPLSVVREKAALIACLSGVWKSDLVDMLALRILPAYRGVQRLATAGTVSEAVLEDEDFVEVHKCGTFSPHDLEEVRQSPEDVVHATRILENFSRGVLPSPAEMLWSSRRAVVQQKLQGAGIRTRLVATSARTNRWR